jgi:hypothetical protein
MTNQIKLTNFRQVRRIGDEIVGQFSSRHVKRRQIDGPRAGVVLLKDQRLARPITTPGNGGGLTCISVHWRGP